ncbi:MAG: hypothetical protein Fur0023_21450 [Bacteroidia bacterium]
MHYHSHNTFIFAQKYVYEKNCGATTFFCQFNYRTKQTGQAQIGHWNCDRPNALRLFD